MNRRTVVLAAAAALLGGCNVSENEPTAPASQVADASLPIGAVPNRYIITLRPGSRDIQTEATRLSKDHRGRVTAVYDQALRGFAVEMQPSDIARLRKDPGVAAVEPDQIVSISGTQSPAPSWGLDRIDQRNLPLSHSFTVGPDGSGVHVYIIDTGILRTHVDFGGRAVFGFDAIQDGNGMTDCHGHGTHVAGTVGGATYGVAKAVRLHAVRVLDCTGSGLVSQVIAGINWVTSHRIKPAVANMSLGGGFSQALNTAVANSIKAGVSYTIAAGNSNLDACTVSPASTPAAITVAASDSNDQRASFSNLGTCVDLFGPGVAITSTWNASNTATMILSGTSMAAPHAAGVVALYLQTHPTATPANVRYALASTATAGVVGNRGFGTPNLLLFTGLFGTSPGNLPPLAKFRLHLHRAGMRLRRPRFPGRSRGCVAELGLRRRDERLRPAAASQLCGRWHFHGPADRPGRECADQLDIQDLHASGGRRPGRESTGCELHGLRRMRGRWSTTPPPRPTMSGSGATSGISGMASPAPERR